MDQSLPQSKPEIILRLKKEYVHYATTAFLLSMDNSAYSHGKGSDIAFYLGRAERYLRELETLGVKLGSGFIHSVEGCQLYKETLHGASKETAG